jgi:hypothetical protein
MKTLAFSRGMPVCDTKINPWSKEAAQENVLNKLFLLMTWTVTIAFLRYFHERVLLMSQDCK